MMSVLEIKGLKIKFTMPTYDVYAVNGVDLSVSKSEVLAVVGESGSGKSQIFMAAMGLLAGNGKISGSIKFKDQEIVGMREEDINKIRGSDMAMIFQDPMMSLNPYLTILTQMNEVLITHRGMSYLDATKRSLELLDLVKIPEARQKIRGYPHELSGGQRQRVMIAISLLCNPALIIADEPTTALDVTIQAQILALLQEVIKETKVGLVLITHDLGVVASMSDNVAVMYGGIIAEYGSADTIFYKPHHPYTKALISASPSMDHSFEDTLPTIPGQPPVLYRELAYCPFSPRCPYVMEKCLERKIPGFSRGKNHISACVLE